MVSHAKGTYIALPPCVAKIPSIIIARRFGCYGACCVWTEANGLILTHALKIKLICTVAKISYFDD